MFESHICFVLMFLQLEKTTAEVSLKVTISAYEDHKGQDRTDFPEQKQA